jgi:bacillithiol biosynthesis cysteine-adding enzyme BshC
VGSNQVESPVQSDSAGEPTTRIAVDVRRFPWTRRLAADYAYNFSSLAPFFSGDPTDRAAWAHSIRCAQANTRYRSEMAQVLASQQAERGAPARAREAARQLADPRAVALVTGQQAGLFGGPLFTLHKALTALKLAEKVSREHNVPVVAVFWIDAEDHDWNEVRSCTVFDEALGTHSISLPARSASADPTPVATVKLDRSISTALDELESVLAPTEFRAGLMADLREAYSPGMGMASAFGRWLERVLGPRGLVVYDSSDPATKPLAADVFIRELTSPGETSKLAATTGADLVARGYHVQVQPQDEAVAVFHLDGGRRPIRQQDGQFVIGERRYAPSDLIQEARTTPAAFSPNVLLRPVVQDTLFPTICYVAGPNELAYLGQLRQIYDRFGVQMPLMYPRASATLVDSGALRFLQKYKLPLEALQPQDESSLNQLLEAQIPTSVEDSFSGVAHAIETTMGRLVQTIPALDPTLQGAAQSTLGRMQHDLSSLHNKIIQAAKRRDETLRRQYTRARALAFPQGHAQERTIGFISFLNQYGPALIDRLDSELPLDPGHHWIVSV